MIALALLLACGSPGPEQGTGRDGGLPDQNDLDLVALYEAQSDGGVDVKPLPAVQDVPFQPDGRNNGDMVPAAELPLADGSGSFDVATLVGPDGSRQAAVVAFMASWCAPCEASLPVLADLERRYGDVGFVIYTIDVSVSGRRKMLERARTAGVQAPIVVGPPYVQRAWLGKGQAVPRFFVVDRNGQIVNQDRGFDEGIAALLPRQIERALARAY